MFQPYPLPYALIAFFHIWWALPKKWRLSQLYDLYYRILIFLDHASISLRVRCAILHVASCGAHRPHNRSSPRAISRTRTAPFYILVDLCSLCLKLSMWVAVWLSHHCVIRHLYLSQNDLSFISHCFAIPSDIYLFFFSEVNYVWNN